MMRFDYRNVGAALAAIPPVLLICVAPPLVAENKNAAPASRPAPNVSRPMPNMSRPAPNVSRPAANVVRPPAPNRATGAANLPSGRGMTNPVGGQGATNANTGRGAAPGAPYGGRGVFPSGGRGPAPAIGRGSAPLNTGRDYNAAGRGPARPGFERSVPGGGVAHYAPNGHVNEIRRPGLVARDVPGGRRVFVADRPDGRRIVAFGHGGYVEHGFGYRGQVFVQRTYVINGRPFVRVYRPVAFRGVVVNVYSPARFYAPGFYAYVYTPWPRPIVYTGWGWAAAPWYPVYGVWFTPYPVYAGPSFWLTDYVIANGFQDAYQAQVDAANSAAPAGGAPVNPTANNFTQPLTPELKQQIAAEVQYQLQQQQAQAQAQAAGQTAPTAPTPPASLPILDSRPHTLQVFTSINVVTTAGGDCALTESDILQFNGAQPADGVNATANVRYSKAQDCPVNSMVSVPVDQLQEMSNHMTEVMEQGLNEYQAKQGQNGLPRLASAMTATTPAAFADGIPPAEPDVQAELQQAASEGAAALNSVPAQQTAAQPGGFQPGAQAPSGFTSGSPRPGGFASGAAPAAQPAASSDIGLGQTPEQVRAAWGQPLRQANVGSKLIYFYRDSKVVFENGVVVDIN